MTKGNGDSTPTDDQPTFGVAWYSEIEWVKLKQAAADPEILEDTYAEWCSAHADVIEGLRQAGAECYVVPVLIDEASDWCASFGRPLDAEARAAFVAEKLRQSQ